MRRKRQLTTDEELALGCIKLMGALVLAGMIFGFALAVIWHAVQK